MQTLPARFDRLDLALPSWMARQGISLLRISLRLVILGFAALKFFPGLSPGQDLAARTIEALTFGLLRPGTSIPALAAWETLVGLGLLTGVFLRGTLFLLWVQMLGTITPLLLFPSEAFMRFPIAPTLEGQYIIKNVVLISAGPVIGATVRGGRLSPGVRAPGQSDKPARSEASR
jgi:uncharacterized membrane protein YkgB